MRRVTQLGILLFGLGTATSATAQDSFELLSYPGDIGVGLRGSVLLDNTAGDIVNSDLVVLPDVSLHGRYAAIAMGPMNLELTADLGYLQRGFEMRGLILTDEHVATALSAFWSLGAGIQFGYELQIGESLTIEPVLEVGYRYAFQLGSGIFVYEPNGKEYPFDGYNSSHGSLLPKLGADYHASFGTIGLRAGITYDIPGLLTSESYVVHMDRLSPVKDDKKEAPREFAGESVIGSTISVVYAYKLDLN